MRKKVITIIGMLTMMLALVTTVQAAGIVQDCYPNHPCEVSPGQSGTKILGIQNMVGDEDLTFRVTLIQNEGNIVTVEEGDIFVPYPSEDIVVNVEYSIPEDATPGTEYDVVISFETVTPGGGGVSIGTRIDANLPFLIVEQSEEPPAESPPAATGIGAAALAAMVTAVLIVIILVILIVRRKKSASFTTEVPQSALK